MGNNSGHQSAENVEKIEPNKETKKNESTMNEGFRLPVFSPGGEKSWINVDGRIQNGKELKIKALETLPWTQKPHLDNVQLVLDGQTLDDSTPLSECTLTPSSKLHLVLRVKGGGPCHRNVKELGQRSVDDSPSTTASASSDSSQTTNKEKFYDINDQTFTFVDREDEMDFLCEGFKSSRALMSCGHAVTPTSLTNWCLQQLDEGSTTFMCGQTSCNVEWSYEEVCRMALLTSQEKRYFKRTIKSNNARRNTKACPGCYSPVVRWNTFYLRVCCSVCTSKNGRIYDFCWQCMKEWRGPDSHHCGNDNCGNESLKTLQMCPDAVFEFNKHITGCPSVRACPRCGVLQQHDTEGCKNVVCPRCEKEFCFVCLKSTRRCLETTQYTMQCSRYVAPRQTSIPVWQKE